MTWLATSKKRTDAFAAVRLDCRKSNLVKRPESRLLRWVFTDNRINVAFDAIREPEIDEPDQNVVEPKRTVADQVNDVLLALGPQSREELKKALPEVTADALRMALNRGAYVIGDDGRFWNEDELGPLCEWKGEDANITGL